jgi:predicted O-methyltransferase YrrM
MLHADVLTVLAYLAEHSEGNVLEIGPYLGGSTMATAIGLRASGRARLFVTVEKGGEMDRRRLFSRDIVRDLSRNLADNGLAHQVEIVVGHSLGPETVAAVQRRLPRQSVSLLIIDADGQVRDLFELYHELLADNCWVVIDDYFARGVAEQKSAFTKLQVEGAIAAGELEELGFYGWGTWIGRWHRDAGATAKKR